MGVRIKGTVFKNEHEKNGEVWFSYNLSISSKNMNGEWINASMPIRFRKGTSLINKSRIEITDGWMIVIQGKEKNLVGVFANEFEVMDGASVQREPEGFSAIQDDDIPF